MCAATKVAFDGSDVAKRPTEFFYIFAPWLALGTYGPPLVATLAGHLHSQLFFHKRILYALSHCDMSP